MGPETLQIERMARVILNADVPIIVAEAMDCWVAWMAGGEIGRGYPKKSIGFVTGGINCWDDLEDSNVRHMAISVDSAIRSLTEKSRNCVYIVWLGMLICYKDTDVDAVAAEAMKYIHRGLIIRGAV